MLSLPTGKRPELRHLVKLLACVSFKWNLVGGQLGVDENFINELRISENLNETKLTDILQRWMKMKPTPVTWENVIEVVGGPVVKAPEVAKDIRQSLKQMRIEQRRAKRKGNLLLCLFSYCSCTLQSRL